MCIFAPRACVGAILHSPADRTYRIASAEPTSAHGAKGNAMKLKLGTAQFHHRANDKAYNLSVVERLSREAAAAGVKILAFPEMCVTGYWHVRNLGREELEALAEPVPDGAATTENDGARARARHGDRRGPDRARRGRRPVQRLRLLPARRFVRLPPQAARVRERAHPQRRPLHGDRLAARRQDRHPDLLRQQPGRERPGRPPCSAPTFSSRRIRPAAATRAVRSRWA